MAVDQLTQCNKAFGVENESLGLEDARRVIDRFATIRVIVNRRKVPGSQRSRFRLTRQHDLPRNAPADKPKPWGTSPSSCFLG